ncbi:MAG: hypothetical protein QM639_16335 [Rhodocyclaceae bacterium]
MKPLRIDFSGRSRLWAFEVARPAQRAWAIVLAAGVVLAASGGAVAWSLKARQAQVEAARVQLEAARAPRVVVADEGAQLSPQEQELVGGAVAGLNYPWAGVLTRLEASMRPGLSMVSLELGAARQGSKLILDAPDVTHALPYVDSLRREPLFRHAMIVKQESVTLGDNVTSMRFTVEAPSVAPDSARTEEGR